MSRVTVSAPANIALLKYWGSACLDEGIPLNRSLSMTLETCRSRTTSEHLEEGGEDEVWIAASDGSLSPPPAGFRRRAERHLDALRRITGLTGAFRITTSNSFPADAGLASSASGFAALAIAVTRSAGLDPGPEELSVLARASGSGSAARSTFGGYVLWPGSDDPESPARQLAPASHWPLVDLVAVVAEEAKSVSSREGHERAVTSPHFGTRQDLLPPRLDAMREAIVARDLDELGPLVEEEAIELHLVAMSSRPPVFYWRPETLTVLETVRELRAAGLPAYATIDAGPNVHVLCEPTHEDSIAAALGAAPGVVEVIHDRTGEGPRLEEEHLR